MGSFPMIVGYFLTIFSEISSYSEFLCRYIVYPFSFDCSPSCCGFDPQFPFLALWVLGSFGLFFHFIKTLVFENLSYSKKQQEQAEAQNKQYHQSINSERLC